ncbi:hypothetical protein [Azospirillum argentinense]
MIIKGSSRGQSATDVRRLADHLLDDENETVEVAQVRGTAATGLRGALAEMRAVSLGSRTRKALYHASINVGRDEAPLMTRERWLEAVDELERHLGLTGHPRAVVVHVKRQREHVHVVWSRCDPVTLKCTSDSNNYAKHEACARALEERLGLRSVIGAHTRPADTPRPVAAATHADWQAAERTGVAVADVAARIQGAWNEAANGREFAAALARRGLSLACGRRGILIVDEVGTPHSVSRRLGLKAAAVRAKLADIDEASLPTLDEVKPNKRERSMKEKKKPFGATAGTMPPVVIWDNLESWWQGQGATVVRQWDSLWIDYLGTRFKDYGDRVEIHSDAEPTDEQIAALVSAGKARGWQTIRFYGGSESFQRRARLEALRQGYPPEAISLECEDHLRGRALASETMPEHLRRKLGLPDPAPATPTPDETPPPDQVAVVPPPAPPVGA